MANEWLQRWDDRYSDEEYAYGTEPNAFLKEQLQKLNPGSILFGAEGEGRNAVYAGTKGWDVHAFDISEEGKKKALKLANEKGVNLGYKIGQLPDLEYSDEQFDVIALIYAHFPPSIKSIYHKLLASKLKKGGIIILEAFGKNHLEYRNRDPQIGGPASLDALFSVDEIRSDFENYEIELLEEVEVELNEGLYHIGRGSVVRFVGRKK